jgi:3-oxoacyl-[acyl-carrier protein] reductase
MFDEQVALVTGAGSAQGIGFAVARRLYAAGAQVTITSTTPRIHERAREIDSGGQRILAIEEDLTDEAAAQRLVESVLQRFGRIDVLVNNAGMAQIDRPLESKSLQSTSYADWRRQIDITLHTAFLMTRAVLPVMAARRYGRIVNVSSVTGPLVSNPGSAAYGAAKAAMDGMMRAVAIETAGAGITINGSLGCTRPSGGRELPTKLLRRCASWLRAMPPTSRARRLWWTAATFFKKTKHPDGRMHLGSPALRCVTSFAYTPSEFRFRTP